MNNNQVQEIKDRIDIADLIGQYVILKKSGTSFKALCPFHKERTPSFIVTPEKQIFKCFGCGEGGDIFSFIQKMEGLTFVESLRLLAARVGIQLDRLKDAPDYKAEQDVKADLFILNATAAKLFHLILQSHPTGQKARDYLSSRGINQQSIERFQLGYAPTKPVLASWCTKNGISPTLLTRAGNPDRFRDRIIFPLKNPLGNVVGFTARALTDDQQPKYLNTPETAIFQKGKLVYGLFEGKQSIKKYRATIMLEGQMDVILSHQSGMCLAVASSGTALTTDHLRIISRYAPKIYFSFDQDEAGLNATKKALTMVLETDLSAAIINLPAGFKDAAELIVKNPKAWHQAINRSEQILDWLMAKALANAGDNLDALAKKNIAREILPFIVRILDPIEQAHYLARLAKMISVSEKALTEAITRIKHPNLKNNGPILEHRNHYSLFEQLLGIILLHPQLVDELKLTEDVFAVTTLCQQIDKLFRACYFNERLTDTATIINVIKKKLDQTDQTALELIIAQGEQLLDSGLEPLIVAQGLISRIKKDRNEEAKKEIALEIAQAENAGDRLRVKELLIRLGKVLK